MKINSIQQNTAFGAKVRILGNRFDEQTIAKFAEKAQKIGKENDIIEFRFMNMNDTTGAIRSKNTVSEFEELVESFKARFIPEGEFEGTERMRDRFDATNRTDMLRQEKEAVENYLDRLIKRFSGNQSDFISF